MLLFQDLDQIDRRISNALGRSRVKPLYLEDPRVASGATTGDIVS